MPYLQRQSVDPTLLVEIEKHFLLQLILSIIDGDRIVMAIEAMYQRLDRRLG